MTDQSPPSLPPSPSNATDEAFFVLRDTRECFIQRLEQLSRLCSISNGAREGFIQKTGEAFDALATGSARGGFGETAGLTASRISLVGNDALELEIRIGDILHRLKDDKRIDHWRTQLRLTALLRRPQMTSDDNPVGFSALEEGLWGLCDAIDGDIDRKLDALERIEEQLQLKLPEVYNELNALLEGKGVNPAPPPLLRRTGRDALMPSGMTDVAPGSGRSPTPSSNPFAALQHAVVQQTAQSAQFMGTPSGSFPSLNFTGEGASPLGSTNPALNASALIMLNQLMGRLCDLEANLGRPTPLRSRDFAEALPGQASLALDTLAMIFDGVFATPELPETIKSAIARLQIPLVRIAIADPEFFASTDHPARQLVNRMADAARGLGRNCGLDHPLCAALDAFATTVRQTLDKAPLDAQGQQDLSPLLDTIETLIERKEGALQRAAEPYIALTEEQEAREIGALHSAAWLQSQLDNPALPAQVADFFTHHWQRRMQQAYMADNTEGEQWQAAASCAADLAWSTTPQASPEHRQRLAALIPTLIRRINTGLDELGVPATERTPFLDAFFELQTAALRNRSTPPLPRQRSAAAPADTPIEELLILERHGKLVQYIAGATSPTPSPLTSGEWLTVTLPDGERLFGRYCGNTSRGTRAVLHSTEWAFAVALPISAIEAQLKDGRAERAPATPLFDRAATLALEQLGHR